MSAITDRLYARNQLCAMLTHQYAHTAAEVEARIDRFSSPLQSQFMAYHRQRDQGG